MNRPNYRRSFLVGIFIFSGIVIFIAGVFTVGSQQKFFEKKFILKAVFDDVGGLQKGNNVWLSGLKIGTVKKITFCDSGRVEVTMSLEQKAQLHIRKDAHVKISTDGFIGNKIIVIYGGTVASGGAADGDFLKSSKSLSTDDMLAMLQSSNENFLEITGDFKTIAHKIASGEGTVGRLIEDPTIARNLQVTIRNLRNASLKMDETVGRLGEFATRLQEGKGLVSELITDTIVFEQLRQSVAQLKDVIDTATLILHNFQKASNQLNQTNNAVGVMLNDKQVAQDLQETINHSKISSQKLEEDLEAIQHNFLLRGYFKKKNKTQPPTSSGSKE